MEITFAGAAREVTGSCHIVRVNGKNILLDCGLFQGRRRDVEEKNRRLPLPTAQIDAVVLSHAHIDHAGRLPFLVREGYAGRIHSTVATRDLCEVMLADSAHIQEKDAEFLRRHNKSVADPLYALRDVSDTLSAMSPHRYDDRFEVTAGVTARFVDAGHILGSASVVLEWMEGSTTRRLGFSGDIGRSNLPIIRDPSPPTGLDWVIMESTYGNRDHESVEGARDQLARIVRETAARGGRIMIPAFAVGRTQELLYDLRGLMQEGKVPRLPVYVDSPLANEATAVFHDNADDFDQTEALVRRTATEQSGMFEFAEVRFTPSIEESKGITRSTGPAIVIAASGMCESGRILHHLMAGAGESRNTVLVVGFMAEHTLGRRIVERQPTIKVFGDQIPLRAQVEVLNGYSAHADRTELRAWLDAVREGSPQLKDVFLVHGEARAQDAFAASLTAGGYSAHCPQPLEHVSR